MPSRHEIKCVNETDRDNPYERIKAVGGQNSDGTLWKLTQEQAIEGIASGKRSFYVSVRGSIVSVIVAVSCFGNKYLKTGADGEQPNNLLSLYECA